MEAKVQRREGGVVVEVAPAEAGEPHDLEAAC